MCIPFRWLGNSGAFGPAGPEPNRANKNFWTIVADAAFNGTLRDVSVSSDGTRSR